MRIGLTIGQRTALGFALLIALVVVASVIGLLYTRTVEQTVNTTQIGIDELSDVDQLQINWLAVVATVDNMLLTRQAGLVEQTLNAELAAFNDQLDVLDTAAMGGSFVLVSDARLLSNVQSLGNELSGIVTELSQVAAEGRWARAQILRHTDMASLQRRLNASIAALNDDIQNNVSMSVAAAVEAQDAIRTYWVIVSVAAVVIGATAGYLTTRSITRPVAALVTTAQAIERGQLDQRADVRTHDEIGALATAFNSMTEQLKDLIDNLETRVSSRTRDLQIAADVSRQVTTVIALETLLPQIVELTRDGFKLYHVSVFVYDDTAEVLKLAAATGSAGEKMLTEGKHFRLDDPLGLVPRAARSREAVIINDVAASRDHFFNPVLPLTKSEMALPMVASGQLVGVLDLQAEQTDRFTDDDLRVLTTLAEQVAVAVRNAELFAEVEQARHAAEEANKVKSQFLANMSHELRTPLNAILNFTEIVADGVLGDVNEKQVDALRKSVASGDHLLSLINDVLDITKIEVGMMQLFIEDVDMNAVVQSVLSTAHGLMKDKPDVELVTHIDSDLPTLQGDKRRLRQILLNLLSNAVKFTPSGTITLSIRRDGDQIAIAVQDTGVGIAPDDQSLVFETFRQTRHGLAERSGTGLGLPISKHFAEAHGGRMWLESEVNVGSTFYVELPVDTRLDRTLASRPGPARLASGNGSASTPQTTG